ncbi:MAG: carboxypeptidase regulatory-like domain-containing protein, partial [Bacteroidales bacterium]|nr:carboxypeptidase regulatory-like domain-containing protein [Bacteroidales bacterium]
TVTVVDDIIPTVSCPGNQDRCADETVSDTYTATGGEFDYTAADDNCTVVSVDYVLTGATNGTGSGTLDGIAFNSGVTTVTWTAVDQSTNSSIPCSFTVNVVPSPDPNIIGNTVVVGGSTEVYQTTYVPGNVYAWSAIGGTVIVNPSPNDYICEVIWDAYHPSPKVIVTETNTTTGCQFTDELDVTINPIQLQGTVKYHNNSHTPMNNVTVRLKDGASVIATTTTDPTGYFSFASVAAGNYSIEVETVKAWGGGNSTDALAIQRTAIAPVSPFPWWIPDLFIDNVGDVNESGNLSSLDALLVKQRTVHLISSFPAGEWAFWKDDGDNINGVNFINTSPYVAYMPYTHSSPVTLDIRAMCYGDVNGSYLPPSTKSMLAVEGEGIMEVFGNKEFTLPVQIMGTSDPEIGAMSVFLNYDDLKVRVKALNSEIPGLIHNIENGWINVAWSDLQPLNLSSNRTIFTLVLEALTPITDAEQLFMLSGETQFADMNCNVLHDVFLNIDRVKAELKVSGPDAEYSLNCYPNPVKEMLNIAYTLPESGNVRISVVNSLGVHVNDLVNEAQEAGQYLMQFDPGHLGLGTGVYYCRMMVDGESSSFNEIVRFIYKQ